MLVHVICFNDSIEYAVIDDEEKAKSTLEELRKNHFERNKHQVGGCWTRYKEMYYWHIHTVEGA